MLLKSKTKAFRAIVSMTLVIALVFSMLVSANVITSATTVMPHESQLAYEDDFSSANLDSSWVFTDPTSGTGILNNAATGANVNRTTHRLDRPTTEACVNQSVSIEFTASGTSSQNPLPVLWLRLQSNATDAKGYYAMLLPSNKTAFIRKIGTNNNAIGVEGVGLAGNQIYLNSGNKIRVTFTATGTNPTTLKLVIENLSEGKTMTCTTTDTDSALQKAGTSGVSYNATAANQTFSFTKYRYINLNDPAVDSDDQMVYSDNFNSGSEGKGWVYTGGSAGGFSTTAATNAGSASINNGMAVINNAATAANGNRATHRLERPMSEATLNQAVSVEFTATGNSSCPGPILWLRSQNNTDNAKGYFAMLLPNSNYTRVFIRKAGTTAYQTTVEGAGSNPEVYLNSGNKMRMTFIATGSNPTTLTLILENVSQGTSKTWTVTDSDSALQNAGTAGVSYNPTYAGQSFSFDNFKYYDLSKEIPTKKLAEISYDDDDVYYSPHTWYDSGDARVTVTSGAYIKMAFEGDHLGIRFDPGNSLKAGETVVSAYIDGGSEITKNFGAAVDNELVITDGELDPNEKHYAIIYILSVVDRYDRWTENTTGLQITGFTLSENKTTLSLEDTPINPSDKSLLIYGDSIAAGLNSFVATFARENGFEYGQVAYGGMGWSAVSTNANAVAAPFYTGETATQTWDSYVYGASRLDGNGKFIEGAPTAIINNLGTNDGNDAESLKTNVRPKVKAWLEEVRAASSPETDIYMILRFHNNGQNTKEAVKNGVNDYLEENPNDKHVYIVDLRYAAGDAIQNNTTDYVHPNDTGSAIIASLLEDALTPLAPESIQPQTSVESVTLTWEAPDKDLYGITHLMDGYKVEYKEQGQDWTEACTVDKDVLTATVTGLESGKQYEFRVTTIGTGLVESDTAFITCQAQVYELEKMITSVENYLLKDPQIDDIDVVEIFNGNVDILTLLELLEK